MLPGYRILLTLFTYIIIVVALDELSGGNIAEPKQLNYEDLVKNYVVSLICVHNNCLFLWCRDIVWCIFGMTLRDTLEKKTYSHVRKN